MTRAVRGLKPKNSRLIKVKDTMPIGRKGGGGAHLI